MFILCSGEKYPSNGYSVGSWLCSILQSRGKGSENMTSCEFGESDVMYYHI